MAGEIEINEELEHQRRAGRVRIVGRLLMAILVLAALFGTFGGGALSKARVEAAGAQLDYERISRFNSPSKLKLRIPPSSSELNLSLSSEFLERIDIERIDPEPKEIELSPGKQIWRFPVSETNGPVEITVQYRPDAFGNTRGEFDIEGRGKLQFSQFYFP